jgi:hypothetical protein
MSVKIDSQIGLTATVPASRDQVVAVAQHAAGVLRNKAEISVASAKLTIGFYPGLVKAVSRRSPTAAIDLKPAGDDKVSVRVRMERWTNLQSRMFFIPIGPKRISGKSEYITYLRALEQELRALGAAVEHTGTWR